MWQLTLSQAESSNSSKSLYGKVADKAVFRVKYLL